MANYKYVREPVIEILCERESGRSIAEEISLGMEEQGIKARIQMLSNGNEWFSRAVGSAQRGYGVSVCITNSEILIFAEDTENECPLFRYPADSETDSAMLRRIGRNAVYVITRQPFEMMNGEGEKQNEVIQQWIKCRRKI